MLAASRRGHARVRRSERYHSRGMADPCDVCGAAGEMSPLVEAGLPGVGAVRIWRCAGCGFRQVRPRLPLDALDALYGADYFDSTAAHGFAGYARQRQRYERDAFFLARELRRLAPGGRFLEVGSALGFLLAALRPMTGWEVEGVEVSDFGAWYARDRFGASVHWGTLEGAALPAETFDYVLQKDLLEHVTHPRRHLEETGRIMRRGARLRVITPNGEADLRPLLHAASPGSDELPLLGQAHLSFFSRAQLLRLFDGVGFRVLRLRSIGVRRGLRALGVVSGWRRRRPLVARRRALAPRDGSAASAPEVPAPTTWAEQAARIDAEIAAHHRRVRSWPPYFHYRRLVKRLGTLPGSLAIGQDFDVLVEKR